MTFGEPTYRVSELNEEIREILGEAFRGLWVRGEIHRPRASQRGHLYFELLEKGRGDQIVGKLDAVAWRTDHQRIVRQLRASDQRLSDGMEVRCYGGLDFYGPGGRLQFVVREVDPLFTLGRLERRRRETLKALADGGLLERNRSLPMPPLPLRIGLVTSAESAAYHDFMTGLIDSGYGFRVLFAHAAVQGPAAEREVPGALELLGSVEVEGRPLDAVVVIRGGGSKTDLAAFDSRAITEAVCRCPLPVICGLGHEIDQSLADLVCHTSLKTPTRVAEHLAEAVAVEDVHLRDTRREIVEAAERALRQAREQMRRAEQPVRLASLRLDQRRRRLEELSGRLERAGRRVLQAAVGHSDGLARELSQVSEHRLLEARRRPEELVRRIAEAASSRLERHAVALDSVERLCHGLAPERMLEKGWSLTFNDEGALVREPDQVRSGDRLTTRIARGVITSRAEPQEQDP